MYCYRSRKQAERYNYSQQCLHSSCLQTQGNEGEHMVLRRKVVDFMQEHEDDFAPYMEDDEDFGSYCKRMAKACS